MFIQGLSLLGRTTLQTFAHVGKIALFLWDAWKSLIHKKLDIRKTCSQMNFIGVNSLSVVVITGLAVGAVLAWQTYIGVKRYGTEQFIGPIVFLAMVREFGPVLSAIMVAGRAGSAMTAEIGTMQISEQVDALKTLGIDVHRYLIVPRIVAATLIMPFLSLFCSACGIFGGYFISICVLGINSETYMEAIRVNVMVSDIFSGLIKAVVFGFLLALIGSYKGYTTRGGAKDVGHATTQSVVQASLSILVSDYILTAILSSF